jgi:uncharacterized membrane protein YhhN
VLLFDFDDQNIHQDFLDQIHHELVYTEFFSSFFLTQYLYLEIVLSKNGKSIMIKKKSIKLTLVLGVHGVTNSLFEIFN